MKTLGKMILAGFLAVSVQSVFATPHIMQMIISENGTWNANVQVINEQPHAKLVDENGDEVKTFTVSKDSPKKMGLEFDSDADFDLAYTITLTEQKTTNMSSKSCIFLVTAKSAGKPDFSTHSYNGATCTWKASGRDQDFFVA